jgi:hypothetical protein
VPRRRQRKPTPTPPSIPIPSSKLTQPPAPQSFDTRHAAALSLASFFTLSTTTKTPLSTTSLPALSALYTALIDDDDEVRETAALAASRIINTPAVAPAAADALTAWLLQKQQQPLANSAELRARVVCRIVGQPYAAAAAAGDLKKPVVVAAEEQLRQALDFDDSLFAAEEQNLFVDEVRETVRWVRVLEGVAGGGGSGTTGTGDDDAAFGCLRGWVVDGLRALVGLAQKVVDSPLGWTSDQHVFAVCARVLLGAAAVVRVAGEVDGGVVGELLGRFRVIGAKAGVHGALLEMARVEVEVKA